MLQSWFWRLFLTKQLVWDLIYLNCCRCMHQYPVRTEVFTERSFSSAAKLQSATRETKAAAWKVVLHCLMSLTSQGWCCEMLCDSINFSQYILQYFLKSCVFLHASFQKPVTEEERVLPLRPATRFVNFCCLTLNEVFKIKFLTICRRRRWWW